MQLPGFGLWVAAAVLAPPLLSENAQAQTASVSIQATQPVTAEPRPDARIIPGEFTVSRDIAGPDPLEVFVGFGGSAIPGLDYVELPAQVIIPAGEQSIAFQVIALSDSDPDEGEENVVATLQLPSAGAPEAYRLGPQNWAEVVIHDGPAIPLPPLITIQGISATPEYCGPNVDCPGIDFRLTRTGSFLEEPLTVFLHYEGAATVGVDYHALPESVTFGAGEAHANLHSIAIDDDLVEGDEDVVAVIADAPPEPTPAQPAYRHVNTSNRATVVIRDNDGPRPAPVVTITADGFPPKTGEPCPVCFVAPVQVSVSRSGPLDEALSVELATGGTAISGVDYHAVPELIQIPAGQPAASFFVTALDDAVPEGPEAVGIFLRPSPNYIAGEPAEIYVVIADDEPGAPAERLDFILPANGAAYPAGVASIQVVALGISTAGEINQPVEFYANDLLLGRSDPPQYGRPAIPFLPTEHEIGWSFPEDGSYTVTARVEVSLGKWLEAAPITLTVGEGPPRPVVSIVATESVAEETSDPTLRPFVYRGVFTISRTGTALQALPVYLHISGSAVSGIDYEPLPFVATIPAGSSSAAVTVTALPDLHPEPLETVVVEISNCPPPMDPPLGLPCYDFAVDAAHQRATVFVRDDGITRASLEITQPADNAHFSLGEPITIAATAIDIDGAITSVAFFAGDHKIGSSEIVFVDQPDPGTPILHTFTWSGATAGGYELTARAAAESQSAVSSLPVRIMVDENQAPQADVLSPVDGAQFSTGVPVEIIAVAADPDGYVEHVAFFANGRQLGETAFSFLAPPPPGSLQTFSFTWRDAPPGSHVLSVRFRDDDGAQATAEPVVIQVTLPDALPLVAVQALDSFGIEPSGELPANSASFQLRRYGPIALPLAVNYSLSGSATNGTDYERLDLVAVFPAGEGVAVLTLTPLANDTAEGRESVVIEVQPQHDDGPQRYHVGSRNRAVAVIADASWRVPDAAGLQGSFIGDGFFHLWFPASPAPAFRVEASEDLRRWLTIHESASPEGVIHFVDPEHSRLPERFYRVVEDAAIVDP